MQPVKVLYQLFTTFWNVVKGSLRKFKKISFSEACWNFSTSIQHKFLQIFDPLQLKLTEVVPTEVHFSVIIVFHVHILSLFAFWNEKVGLQRWHVVHILQFVERIIWIGRVWLFDSSSFQLIYIFV